MKLLNAEICSLLVGGTREIAATGSGAWWDKPWSTSFYREPQTGVRWLGYEGFRGDEATDRRYHGGVDKAVCVYPSEHYPDWRSSLNLPEMAHGAFGENLTTRGLLENDVCIGDLFSIGEVRVQVSQPRQPCWKLARRWRIKDLTAQVERTGRTGWYFRVLSHGNVNAGAGLTLIERPYPEWTIERCNGIMLHGKEDLAAARALAACSRLSASWKDGLWSRAEQLGNPESKLARITPP